MPTGISRVPDQRLGRPFRRLAARGRVGARVDGRAHPRDRDRRRRGRREHRLPLDGARLERRLARRARRADIGLDLPFGRTGGPTAVERLPHADDDVRGGPLPASGGRDRCRPRLARGRIPPTCIDERAHARAPPAGRVGAHVRPAARSHLHRRGPCEVPAVRPDRRPGRCVHPDRRAPGPEQSDPRAGRGRSSPRRRDPDEHPRYRDRRPRRSCPRDRDRRARPDRGGRRRQRGWHVREPDRPPGRRRGPRRPVRASIPAHEAGRGRERGVADHARSRPAGVLPRRGGRGFGDGWLRAQPATVGGGGRSSRRLQPSTPSRRLGPVRIACGERVQLGPRVADRRGRHPDQRSRGVHARRRVHPGRIRRARLLRGRRLLRARNRGSRGNRQGHGGLDRQRRARVRRVEDGYPPVRSAVPVAALRAASARTRSTRPITTSTTPARNGRRAGR